jgi:hypothetical protein
MSLTWFPNRHVVPTSRHRGRTRFLVNPPHRLVDAPTAKIRVPRLPILPSSTTRNWTINGVQVRMPTTLKRVHSPTILLRHLIASDDPPQPPSKRTFNSKAHRYCRVSWHVRKINHHWRADLRLGSKSSKKLKHLPKCNSIKPNPQKSFDNESFNI